MERRHSRERDASRDAAFKEKWWLFGRTRPEIRAASKGIGRYIATTRTAKHRVFQFIPSDVLANHEVVVISLQEGFFLGVLSSRFHKEWALHCGGTLEDRPRYNKGKCFDAFPFPEASDAQRREIAELAEELDETRKAVLADVPMLTLTEIYNLADKLRSGQELTPALEDRASAARAGIINRLHQQLDKAVASTYRWPADLGSEDIVARLVALNAERAADEAAGLIRWLRPDYQEPRLGNRVGQRAA